MAVENRTLSQQVYEHVRAEILSGRYQPSTELNEVAAAEELGVSRGPVREAFGRLGAEGLIELRPHRGARVSELTKDEFLDAYEMREGLEGFALRAAVPKLTPPLVQEMTAVCAAMEEAATRNDIDVFFEANGRFHRMFVDAADNTHLTRFYESLTAQMGRYRHVSVKLRGEISLSVAEHRRILDAAIAGDVNKAADLAEAHVRVPQHAIKMLSDTQWVELRTIATDS